MGPSWGTCGTLQEGWGKGQEDTVGSQAGLLASEDPDFTAHPI